MKVVALCHTCRHQHAIDFDPLVGPGAAFSDWLTKHPDAVHLVDFVWPGRSGKALQKPKGWEHYLHNADIKVAYAASANNTITLASLATSASRLTGREGTEIDNTSNKYLDSLWSGKVTTGTTPSASQIDVSTVGLMDDSTWPDVFDGTDSAETVSSQSAFNQICRIVASMINDTSSNITYPFGPVAIASLFGGVMPLKVVPFVAHSTGVNLHATAGNHQITTKGIYATAT